MAAFLSTDEQLLLLEKLTQLSTSGKLVWRRNAQASSLRVLIGDEFSYEISANNMVVPAMYMFTIRERDCGPILYSSLSSEKPLRGKTQVYLEKLYTAAANSIDLSDQQKL